MLIDSGVALEQARGDPSSVRPDPVPEEHEWTSEVPQEVALEAHHLRGANVALRKEPQVERDPRPPGRDTEGRDRRELDPGGATTRWRICPRGPHVARTLGTKRHPLSSRDTRCAPHRSAFVSMRPDVARPGADGLLLALARLGRGPLPTPAERAH